MQRGIVVGVSWALCLIMGCKGDLLPGASSDGTAGDGSGTGGASTTATGSSGTGTGSPTTGSASATGGGTDGGSGASATGGSSGTGAVTDGSTSGGASAGSGGTSATTGAPPDLPETCDPFTQDCPAGYKCAPHASNGIDYDGNHCVALAASPDPDGDPCMATPLTGEDDCELGSLCWPLDGLNGVCRSLCGGSEATPTCDATSVCEGEMNDAVFICRPHCDPTKDQCPTGEACYLYTGTEHVCRQYVDMGLGVGSDCTGGKGTSCPPGTYCTVKSILVNCTANSCCTDYCDLNNPSCTENGAVCKAYFGNPDPDVEHIGFCGAP